VKPASIVPFSIDSNAVGAIRAPNGWSPAVQGPFWLHSAGPMDGPPTELAVLKEGARTKRSGKTTVTKWDLSGSFGAGKWMACNYGYSNDFILSRRLDDSTAECTVTRQEQESGKVQIAILCN
jgi:hypothetical protein